MSEPEGHRNGAGDTPTTLRYRYGSVWAIHKYRRQAGLN